jgi:class 3 adenylate cyclase
MGALEASAEKCAAQAREALRAGNALLCYDLAQRAQQLGLRTRALEYLCLLALANAGNSALAWQRYQQQAPPETVQDEDWLALKGRLLKDLALLSGEAADFRRAADAYLIAFRHTGGYFAAVNAATMFFLAGAQDQARALAQEVLALASGATAADESERYFLSATEAEAALLLGDGARARACLRQADRWQRDDLNVRSRTRAQLRLICAQRGEPDVYSRLLWQPAVIELTRRATAFPKRLDHARPLAERTLAESLAFAALSQPADLCAVEYLLPRGARLHLVVPSARKTLIEYWQREYGAGWAMRLARALEQAKETVAVQGFLPHESAWAASHAAAMARGLARLCARRLGCQPKRLEWCTTAEAPEFRLDPGHRAHAPPSTSESPDPARRCVGLIFADIAGFCRLSDAQMPLFWSQVMGRVARVVDAAGAQVLFRHTWGDAFNLVTADARSAARLALDIQTCIEQARGAAPGVLSELDLRMAAHYAPAYAGYDPIERQAAFYGSQLSFAARVEPVTPPGMIFVTQAFAARLALEAGEEFRLEYAGEVELAKHYGRYRLFGLRAAPARHRGAARLPCAL